MQNKRENGKGADKEPEALYPAIELLNDPQGLAEGVFKRLRANGGSIKFDTKLVMINFVTRLVGCHELLILPLYPFLQRYLGGHQKVSERSERALRKTRILAMNQHPRNGYRHNGYIHY